MQNDDLLHMTHTLGTQFYDSTPPLITSGCSWRYANN